MKKSTEEQMQEAEEAWNRVKEEFVNAITPPMMWILDHLREIGIAIFFFFMFDALFFAMWFLSGQTPQTSVYAGAITANVVRVFYEKDIERNMIIEHSKIPCSIPDSQFTGATESDYPECQE